VEGRPTEGAGGSARLLVRPTAFFFSHSDTSMEGTHTRTEDGGPPGAGGWRAAKG
jgi:hypothetical protein